MTKQAPPPSRAQITTAYVAAFRQHGADSYISNLKTTVELHDWGGQPLPKQGPLDFIKPAMVKLMKGERLEEKEESFVCWL